MNYEVQLIRVEKALTAVVRRQALQHELSTIVPKACGEVWNYVKSSGMKGAGRHVAYYVDGRNVEIGVEVTAPFEGNGEVVCSSLPAGMVATSFHMGDYRGLGGAHEAILRWCREQGHVLAGPSWEIYGHWNDDPAKVRTDIHYLLNE